MGMRQEQRTPFAFAVNDMVMYRTTAPEVMGYTGVIPKPMQIVMRGMMEDDEGNNCNLYLIQLDASRHFELESVLEPFRLTRKETNA